MDEHNRQKRLLKVPNPEKVVEDEDELEEGEIRGEYDIDIGQKELVSTRLNPSINRNNDKNKLKQLPVVGDKRTQINNGKLRIECTDEKGIPVCKICGRNFPSFQILFGHMMCHPEREWRGIGPPDHDHDHDHSSTTDDLNLIDEGDVSSRKTSDHDHDQLSTTDDLNLIDEGDVYSRKRSWRSQVGINSEEEDVADNFEATNSNSLTSKNDFGVKLRSFDEEASDESRLKKMKSMTDLKLGLDDSSTPTFQAHENPAVEGTSTTQPDNKYKCNICNKSFPTHQALGGHKSSHNKFKINIGNAVADKKDDGGDNGRSKLITKF